MLNALIAFIIIKMAYQQCMICTLNENSALQLSAYSAQGLIHYTRFDLSHFKFDSLCQSTLEAIASIKPINTFPWIDTSLRSLQNNVQKNRKNNSSVCLFSL